MEKDLSKRNKRGLVLLIGVLVGIFLFFGGFNFNKNITHKNKKKVETESKSESTPILYHFFS